MLLNESTLREFYEDATVFKFLVITRSIEQSDIDTYNRHQKIPALIPNAYPMGPTAVFVNLTKEQVENGHPKLGDFVVHHHFYPEFQWLVTQDEYKLQYEYLRPLNLKLMAEAKQVKRPEQDLFINSYVRFDLWDRLKLFFLGALKLEVKVIVPDCPPIEHFNCVVSPSVVRSTTHFERQSHPRFGYVHRCNPEEMEFKENKE